MLQKELLCQQYRRWGGLQSPESENLVKNVVAAIWVRDKGGLGLGHGCGVERDIQ